MIEMSKTSRLTDTTMYDLASERMVIEKRGERHLESIVQPRHRAP